MNVLRETFKKKLDKIYRFLFDALNHLQSKRLIDERQAFDVEKTSLVGSRGAMAMVRVGSHQDWWLEKRENLFIIILYPYND